MPLGHSLIRKKGKHHGALKVKNNEFLRHSTHFIDILHSKFIILAVYVLLLNKPQEQDNFIAFNAIFGIDVNDVKRLKS